MNIQTPPRQTLPRMTVDEFLVWAEGRPGRYELVDGVVCRMAPEKVRHAETKAECFIALRVAIRRAGVACHALPDGMTVRITERTAFEPDALVYCGDKLPGDDLEVREPVIVVEVISPSTSSRDSGAKLKGYFSLPSVRHYLIVDATEQSIVHHARDAAGAIATRVVVEGSVRLDPPGIEVALTEFFGS
jgi:Uma2 family endonuclease